ncbi:hypothetical protein [Halohasta litchfieldiae]|nr:hypothetical protein [Halohasta litchfieldiae]
MTTPRLWGELDISDFLAVRTAILEVSKKSFNMATLDRLSSKESIEQERKNAKEAGRRAERFDPHSLIFNLIDWISVRKRAVMLIVATAGLIAHFGLGVSEENIVTTISTISSPIFILGISGVILYVIWNFYILLLRYNRKAIQNINKRIRYSDQRIEDETSVENIRAYRRWNSILTNNSSLLCIIILTFTRSFAPSIFSIGTEASNDWVPEYVNVRISNIIEENGKENNDNSNNHDKNN